MYMYMHMYSKYKSHHHVSGPHTLSLKIRDAKIDTNNN